MYNPLAGQGAGEVEARLLEMIICDDLKFIDITKVTNYAAFLGGMEEGDYLIIVGGDGTLNRFANDTRGIPFFGEILYFPMGTGNDFARDLGKETPCPPFAITGYLKHLPTVEVKGKRYRFLNGVGFGIDGYCCQVGDEKRHSPEKKVNYTTIAIGGILGRFSPRTANVTVDGKKYTYQKVWIAPTMYGRYYGGGMMAAPEQTRGGETLSLVLFHGGGRLRTLLAFPGIFQGTHIRNKKLVAIHTGREITVEFDRPTPLQIDGETILDVTQYTATMKEG